MSRPRYQPDWETFKNLPVKLLGEFGVVFNTVRKVYSRNPDKTEEELKRARSHFQRGTTQLIQEIEQQLMEELAPSSRKFLESNPPEDGTLSRDPRPSLGWLKPHCIELFSQPHQAAAVVVLQNSAPLKRTIRLLESDRAWEWSESQWKSFEDRATDELKDLEIAIARCTTAWLEANAETGRLVVGGGIRGSEGKHGTTEERGRFYAALQKRCNELRNNHPKWSKREIERRVGKEYERSSRSVREHCDIPPRVRMP